MEEERKATATEFSYILQRQVTLLLNIIILSI